MKKRTFLLTSFLILITSLAGLSAISHLQKPHPITRVIDGDTVELKNGLRVRLININTPEVGECFASEATQLLSNLTLGRKIRLESDKDTLDRFGRRLGYIFLATDGTFVNQTLLEEGAGEFFLDFQNKKYENLLIESAEKARLEKKGLWGKCADPKYGACLIKGNLDRNDKRFYHLPEFRHYNKTEVGLKNGDRWFCTEAEAKKAGFKPARK